MSTKMQDTCTPDVLVQVETIEMQIAQCQSRLGKLGAEFRAAAFEAEGGGSEPRRRRDELRHEISTVQQRLQDLQGALEVGKDRKREAEQRLVAARSAEDWKDAERLLAKRKELAEQLDAAILTLGKLWQQLETVGGQGHQLAARHMSVDQAHACTPGPLAGLVLARLAKLSGMNWDSISFSELGWQNAIGTAEPIAVVTSRQDAAILCRKPAPTEEREAA